MATNLIILVAAIVVALIVFRALLSLLKTFLSTAIAIFIVIVILKFFGFSPQDLQRELVNLAHALDHLLPGAK
ncbi:hypothetical protein G7B40_019790 [Aetokthonos hydrillicola Thurmond2011]|jgi:uncharacterized protein YacL|uniref:Uncharacterized protein n=1 Tax=Aetokthonos hydrillicola Thurmond2011 TaxID=2712845 RepID=A0AAP5I8U1_9CYAN|nr:hypothetical protein [Aetokthonos hydrillicola]MBO3463010.1 hypothetical protein [Aetokthonos hydrillicola CCALA 1050]MBW4587187.1 hypothetical protein [Aetokthonos hydrillicola CCALA 1050]MDR9896789.1 hypothetical protein [Aetokthonos hydrillicola Thurmond2011]